MEDEYEPERDSSSSEEEMSVDDERQPTNLALRAVLESGEEGFEASQKTQMEQEHILQLIQQQQSESTKPEGACSECETQQATVQCEQCDDTYCEICFTALHRKGRRLQHTTQPIAGVESASNEPTKPSHTEEELTDEPMATPLPTGERATSEYAERAKYIPLRLKYEERKLLRLLEGSLRSSDYTDKVDRLTFKNKARRTYTQLVEICATLSGLVVAADYQSGQDVVQSRSFKQYEKFFKRFFEIGRRHKVMNPEKMRSEYGKLMYILQDSVHPEVQELLEFSCFRPIQTVYDYLEQCGAEAMLDESCMEIATRAVANYTMDGRRKSRPEVREEVRSKENAVKYLTRKYARQVSEDDIQRAIYSIGDNNSFLLGTRDPIEKMIRYLKKYFRPDAMEDGYSLAIEGGREGARLTHAHDRQYYYCLQSLALWREVSNEMFKLWYQADQDLLSPQQEYQLKDTGQGVNRVQQCPLVESTMRQILHNVQSEVGQGNWVGSSVIHLGDHNVPNALMFIDKYTQVSWILNPIVLVMERVEELARDERIGYFVNDVYGGCDKLKKDILVDFFRYGFDGSGADNFFDAGSCIDGRLTSAWNWCSKLHEKPFYPIFKLTGFRGFDGY